MKSQARLRLRQPVAPESVMVRLGPVFWRCECGANVLTRSYRASDGYSYYNCNGCGRTYAGI